MKRFSGEKPELLKAWKQWATAELLAQRKMPPVGETPARHDTSTWGPFLIKLLDGDAAELFEEADLEVEYAIENGHKKVWKLLEDCYPYKVEVDKKLEAYEEKRQFTLVKGELPRSVANRFRKLQKKCKTYGLEDDEETKGADYLAILKVSDNQRGVILGAAQQS